MKAEKSKKSSKGITLIALVITIIVLLILAAVSIATLTGENGILTRAQDAKTQTGVEGEKEEIQLAYAGAVAEKRGTGDVTADDLNREFGTNGTNATAVDNGDGTITVTFGAPSNREYIVDKNGNITEKGTSENPGTGEVTPPQTNITLEQAKGDSMLEKTEDTKVTVDDGTVTVPAGFQIAQDSGSTLNEGIVIEDKNTNQFVWVPVSKENFDTQFVRRAGYYDNNPQILTVDYGEADGNSETGDNTNSQVKESETTKTEVKLMYDSVYNNEGFYIGRYEAGKDSNGNVVIQKGVDVYNNVTWSKNKTMNEESVVEGTESNPDGAIELARSFDEANGYTTVTSTLCYGVQWDATLTWIDPDYTGFAKDSTGKGNYNEDENTNSWKENIAKTGSSSNYEVNKIYDLAGNVCEWTMESYNNNVRAYRGGRYDYSGSVTPASNRGNIIPSYSVSEFGFRVTLYVK